MDPRQKAREFHRLNEIVQSTRNPIKLMLAYRKGIRLYRELREQDGDEANGRRSEDGKPLIVEDR